MAQRARWIDAANLRTARDALGGDRLAASGLGSSACACGVILRLYLRYLYGASA